MFAQDEQPCDSVENGFDGHKKKTRTTTKTPATTTLSTADDHVLRTFK
jgi:hypothetical protein